MFTVANTEDFITDFNDRQKRSDGVITATSIIYHIHTVHMYRQLTRIIK